MTEEHPAPQPEPPQAQPPQPQPPPGEPPQGQAPPGEPPEAAPPTSKDERLWGTFCHLAALAGFIFPFGNVIGPLVLWLTKREDYPFVESQGKESLNFQISVIIYCVVCIPLIFILIGIFLLIALGVFDLAMVIVAAIKANEGRGFKYPITIRFIK